MNKPIAYQLRSLRESLNDPLERQLIHVNEASRQVRNLYLFFLAFSLYIMLVVATVNHVDLLKGTDVQLPILNIGLPLLDFFKFTPGVYVVFYFNLLMQTYMLADKIRHLRKLTKRSREASTWARLHSSPFVHLIAGAHDCTTMHWVFRLFVWITLVFLPLIVLLTMQVRFLPYHSEPITWWSHQLMVLIMVFMMRWMWPRIFHMRGKTKRHYNPLIVVVLLHRLKWFWCWIWHKNSPERPRGEGFSTPYISIFCTLVLSLIATVPDSALDRWYANKFPNMLLSTESCSPQPERQVLKPTAWLFGPDHHKGLWEEDCPSKPSSGLFGRNIDVSERILISQIDEPHSANLNQLQSHDPQVRAQAHNQIEGLDLRGRNLHYANISGAWIPRADLRDADLAYAWGQDVQMQHARLGDANLQGADLSKAELQGADISGTAKLSGVNLFKANLQSTNLSGVNLQSVNLFEASLQGANLSGAKLQGADISEAELQGANLSGAKLQGADISEAELQGANLSKAKLLGAHLYRTKLQGANLSEAELQGANLSTVYLQGADLWNAKLQGAQMGGADLRGADLRLANIYGANFDITSLHLADLRYVQDNPLDAKIIHEVEKALESATEGHSGYKPPQKNPDETVLFEPTDFSDWGEPPSEADYQKELTEYLTDLACQNSAIAGGLAQQFLHRLVMKMPKRNLSAQALLKRAKDPQCKPLAEGIQPYRKKLERQVGQDR